MDVNDRFQAQNAPPNNPGEQIDPYRNLQNSAIKRSQHAQTTVLQRGSSERFKDMWQSETESQALRQSATQARHGVDRVNRAETDTNQQSFLSVMSNHTNQNTDSHIEISLCSLAEDCAIPWIPYIEMSAFQFPSSLLRPLLISLSHPSPNSHLLLDLTQANSIFNSSPTTLPHTASSTALLAAGVPSSFIEFRKWTNGLMLSHAGLAHCFVARKKTQQNTHSSILNSVAGAAVFSPAPEPENLSGNLSRSPRSVQAARPQTVHTH